MWTGCLCWKKKLFRIDLEGLFSKCYKPWVEDDLYWTGQVVEWNRPLQWNNGRNGRRRSCRPGLCLRLFKTICLAIISEEKNGQYTDKQGSAIADLQPVESKFCRSCNCSIATHRQVRTRSMIASCCMILSATEERVTPCQRTDGLSFLCDLLRFLCLAP
jgi:hypothetical protein